MVRRGAGELNLIDSILRDDYGPVLLIGLTLLAGACLHAWLDGRPTRARRRELDTLRAARRAFPVAGKGERSEVVGKE